LPNWATGAIVIEEKKERDLQWSEQRRVPLQFIEPGRPMQNAFIESFNGRLRDACLNSHWFLDMGDARRKIRAWVKDYNEQRPQFAGIFDAERICCSSEGIAIGPLSAYGRLQLSGFAVQSIGRLRVGLERSSYAVRGIPASCSACAGFEQRIRPRDAPFQSVLES
jgi:hypothetical protein